MAAAIRLDVATSCSFIRPDNPTASGAFAMSQPAFDVKRRTVWYTDGNAGFFAVRLTNGTGRLLAR